MEGRDTLQLKRKKEGTGRKRAKTGCRTCRVRHVKCDEERPVCHRCAQAGLVCDGYGIWGGGGSPYANKSPSAPLALSKVSRSLSMIGMLSKEEHGAFDWFMQKNTTRLSGLFTSAFWDDLVFQASAQEPAVRHAVIALSSAQRAENMHRKNPRICYEESDAERFTLQQYNKSIWYLREHHHHTTQSTESTRIVLITCMIFIALEFLRGRYRTGFIHLQSGIKLLSEHERRRHHQHGQQLSSILLGSKETFAQIALVDAFTRLSVHCSFYEDRVQQQEVLVSVREGNWTDPCGLPTSFASVTEARRILDRIYGRIQFLRQSCRDFNSREESRWYRTRNQILIDLSKWETARHAFVRNLNKTTHAHIRDRICFEIMSLYHSMATITTSVCLENEDPENNEMSYDSDAHTHAFARILAGCSELPRLLQLLTTIGKPPSLEQEENHKCEGMGFSIEMGFILPAFFTAVKCRVPRMRRQALYVLRAGLNREAGWDRRVVADMVAAVIRIEEGGFYSSSSSPPYGGATSEIQDLDPPTQKDLEVPRIEAWRRLRDVRIVLPDDERGRSRLMLKRRGDGERWIEWSKEFEYC